MKIQLALEGRFDHAEREFVDRPERIVRNPALSLVVHAFEFGGSARRRLRAAIEAWDGFVALQSGDSESLIIARFS